jgi:chromosome segregation protein
MNSVIKPWLIVGLMVALVGNVLLSAILIIKLGRFDEAKQEAAAVETQTSLKQEELASLKVEADKLSKQIDTLKPTAADWQQRLEERNRAEAEFKSLGANQRQAEADITNAESRLEMLRGKLTDTEKQKAETMADVENLKLEQAALTKTNLDIKTLLNAAVEAERRWAEATNGLINADSQRRQFEADASSAQSRFNQIQKETDDLRTNREALNTELASLRLQLQTLKDETATLDKQSADLKARQLALQQADLKLADVQRQMTDLEKQQNQTVSDYSHLTNRLASVRVEAADWESKRDADQQAATKVAVELTKTKADLQTADDELAATRKQTLEFSTKQGELAREVARFQSSVDKLTTERDSLEKEIGRMEAQQPNPAKAPKQ